MSTARPLTDRSGNPSANPHSGSPGALPDVAHATEAWDVAAFTAAYTAEVARCLGALLPALPGRAGPLRRATGHERGTVYFLGNGGSSAIARTLALTATADIGPGQHGTRWTGAWDTHALTGESTARGFDEAAAHLLRRDSPDGRDLVILISGSGDSANLVAVARHCRAHHIPLLTLTGRTGGALAHLAPRGLRVDSTDQQVVEDVAHAAGLLLLELTAPPRGRRRASSTRGGPGPDHSPPPDAGSLLSRGRDRLVDALRIDTRWTGALADAITDAVAHGGKAIILAPEGGALALSAEHTAHNLRWDLRHAHSHAHLPILDGTSLCDQTGMANDTGQPGLPDERLLEHATGRDVIVLFAHDADHPAVLPARRAATNAARTAGARVFGCYGTLTTAEPHEAPWRTGLRGPAAAFAAQTVGHLVLRAARAQLLARARSGSIGPRSAWAPVAPLSARQRALPPGA